MKIKYEEWNPRDGALRLVDHANQIIKDYMAAGYVLTLRQLYYQFVARDIVENSERSYKNVGSIITRARMAGLVSWEAIEDRNREHHSFWSDEDITNPIRDLPGYIRFDRWDRQEYYIEVWVEKEALGNVVSRACDPYMVPHMSCKGYLSASEAWRAGRRIQEKIETGHPCLVIHLGDHDPSGIDMTRDNQSRLNIFTEYPECIEVRRIALNMDQIDEHRPPPNPAKVTDSRAKSYIREYGKTSWELDALEPEVLQSLIQSEIEAHIDFESWDRVAELEKIERKKLSNIWSKWDQIAPIIDDK